jgi:hypothetical protein
MRVARTAMPGVAIRDAVWLAEYDDDDYYKTVSSFDLGLPRMAKTLPVLRVRYEDATDTWLYVTPAPGQIYKAERLDRANRWATTACTAWTSRSSIDTGRCGISSRSPCSSVLAYRASRASCPHCVASRDTRARCQSHLVNRQFS